MIKTYKNIAFFDDYNEIRVQWDMLGDEKSLNKYLELHPYPKNEIFSYYDFLDEFGLYQVINLPENTPQEVIDFIIDLYVSRSYLNKGLKMEAKKETK